MKKLLAIILSLATAVLASVGLVACGNNANEGENTPPQQSQGTQDNNTNDSNDNKQTPQQPSDEEKPNGGKDDEENNEDKNLPVSDIEFTETEPLVNCTAYYDEESGNYKWNGYDCIKESYRINELKDFVKDNLSGNNLYLLDYKYDELDNSVGGLYSICYRVLSSQTDDQHMISERFSIYEKELGTFSTGGMDVGKRCSVSMSIFIKPIEKAVEKTITFKFGQMVNGNTFINFYYGEECFATCFYCGYEEVPISKEWFENYFNENLIWGDSL